MPAACSRRSAGGNVTLFAFDKGESLTEHTTPFDALALTLDGALSLTIGGNRVEAAAGTIVRLPANVPHAVDAPVAARMLLVMLKDPSRRSRQAAVSKRTRSRDSSRARSSTTANTAIQARYE